MDKFEGLVGRINVLAGMAVAPLAGIITLLVLYEVLMRYILNSPTSWTAEVENYLQIAMVMLGGGYALHHGGHVRVDVIYRNFGERGKSWVDVFTALCVIASMFPIIYYGAELSWEAFETGQTSVTAAEIILWPSMVTVPVGASLVVLQALATGLSALVRLSGPSHEGR
jgi:TRAP-type mannitol/chloroaromatic compound transport system permease small subunit